MINNTVSKVFKYGLEKTAYFDTFHTVKIMALFYKKPFQNDFDKKTFIKSRRNIQKQSKDMLYLLFLLACTCKFSKKHIMI